MSAENVLSVGIDIGTSTTQVIFSDLTMNNTASYFSVPHVSITAKKVVYKSDIYTTPLKTPELIDADGVKEIVQREFDKAGYTPADTDTGAVIITGESARKENAAAVLEKLSGFAGDFVVSTAGPDLESVIAGKGSGNGTMNALTAKVQPVEIIEDHNAAWDGDYEYKDFLPFVVANDVETYREYKLAKAAAGHKKNDIAVYYVKVKISENDETAEIAGAEFEVYVEVSGVIWKNLDEYKNTKNSTKIENIDFYYGSENGNVYYFVHDDYGYHLKFINADDKTTTLTYIAGKFTT